MEYSNWDSMVSILTGADISASTPRPVFTPGFTVVSVFTFMSEKLSLSDEAERVPDNSNESPISVPTASSA